MIKEGTKINTLAGSNFLDLLNHLGCEKVPNFMDAKLHEFIVILMFAASFLFRS